MYFSVVIIQFYVIIILVTYNVTDRQFHILLSWLNLFKNIQWRYLIYLKVHVDIYWVNFRISYKERFAFIGIKYIVIDKSIDTQIYLSFSARVLISSPGNSEMWLLFWLLCLTIHKHHHPYRHTRTHMQTLTSKRCCQGFV